MQRYKNMIPFYKSKVEKKNLELIEDLENKGMIDMMIHQKSRWCSVKNLTASHLYIWQRWVRSAINTSAMKGDK